MPNLRTLINLKKKYSELNDSELLLEEYLKDRRGMSLKKAFDFGALHEHFIGQEKPEIIEYFESNTKETVVLLFIDIANFSTKVEERTPDLVKSYLDNYYRKAFPIIYQYQGQIEKLMGDGIICVFGRPFLNTSKRESISLAEECSKDLIQVFKGTNKEIKIAFHVGEVMYYKPPTSIYEEFTMIGKPITELYRLESVSRVNAINYFGGGAYDSYIFTMRMLRPSYFRRNVRAYVFDVILQGIEYTRVKYMRFNGI
jgi:hypothetical protein